MQLHSIKITDKQVEAKLKGGRPKGQLAEAIQYAYLKFMNEGNTEILRAGKILEFMARFKEIAQEKNRNVDEYIAERIQDVKLKCTTCTITTKEQVLKPGLKRESRQYHKYHVSKILTDLRKKYPLLS